MFFYIAGVKCSLCQSSLHVFTIYCSSLVSQSPSQKEKKNSETPLLFFFQEVNCHVTSQEKEEVTSR